MLVLWDFRGIYGIYLPVDSVQLVNITTISMVYGYIMNGIVGEHNYHFTMVYGRYIELFNGIINQLIPKDS